MSVFVDTGVFYAHHDEDAPRHDAATAAMRAVVSGEFGTPITSDYVYDETVTLTYSRFDDVSEAVAVGNRILGRGAHPDAVDLLFVDSEAFFTAVDLLERYDDQGLSFTDVTTIALVDRHDVEYVLAFDDDFDGLVERIDPETVAAG